MPIVPRRHISKTRIYEQIVLQLQQEILSGQISPGARQGGGTVVRPASEAALLAALSEQLVHSRPAIMNPLEVRYMFEPPTAYLAAERATDAEIAAMAEQVQAQEWVVATGGTGINEDTAFHFAIARASHNGLIMMIVGYINTALLETREWSLRACSGAQSSIWHHRNILAAIAAHDPHAAQTAMASHVEDVQVMTVRWLQERAEVAWYDEGANVALERVE